MIVRRFDYGRRFRRIDIGECIGLAARERRRYEKECNNAACCNATEHFDVPERPDAELECALPIFVRGRHNPVVAAGRLRREPSG